MGNQEIDSAKNGYNQMIEDSLVEATALLAKEAGRPERIYLGGYEFNLSNPKDLKIVQEYLKTLEVTSDNKE